MFGPKVLAYPIEDAYLFLPSGIQLCFLQFWDVLLWSLFESPLFILCVQEDIC